MSEITLQLLMVSDFNVSNLTGYLENSNDSPSVKTTTLSFADFMAGGGEELSDLICVWVQPQSVNQSFQALLDGNSDDIGIENEVHQFCDALEAKAQTAKLIIVPSWSYPSLHRFGLLETDYDTGVVAAIWRMNVVLSERCSKLSNVLLVNAERWIASSGKEAFNSKLWYMAKIPYSHALCKEAALELRHILRNLSSIPKKLLLLDLDHTLWGGIVGDVGWQNLKLGGHDPIGEAYVDFQRAILSIAQRGVVLGMVSKNEETVALEAISSHPEMVLKSEHFAGWRINWEDKAKNIASLVEELNLGLDAAVFIDDNPAERARVAQALPEVEVPEWPSNKMLYKDALLSLRSFDSITLSAEDVKRTQMYQEERRRTQLKREILSERAWLRSLEVFVEVEILTRANLPRATQLLNKTNQMNLRTRRLNEEELWKWSHDNVLWTIRVSDRFGDSGLTGIASMTVADKRMEVVDFLLSCRVFGRKVEMVMLSVLVEEAKGKGAEELAFVFQRTKKNEPCHRFLCGTAFQKVNEQTFVWQLSRLCPYPDEITVVRK